MDWELLASPRAVSSSARHTKGNGKADVEEMMTRKPQKCSIGYEWHRVKRFGPSDLVG